MTAAQQQLQALGQTLIAQQLTWGNAGNISLRLDADHCLISASGTRLGELSPDDLVQCPITPQAPSSPAAAGRRPSKELPMHRAVYLQRPDAQAVIHAAPLYSTLIACAEEIPIPSGLFVESMYYLERVARVAYHHPGSQALGDAVQAAAAGANVLLLENHGVLIFDNSVAEALMALQSLEAACQMLIIARSAGLSLRPLPESIVQDFLQNAGYKARRQWPSTDGRS